MKLFYDILMLTSLIFYSTLSIALIGPWIYRKVQAYLAATRPASKRMAKLEHRNHMVPLRIFLYRLPRGSVLDEREDSLHALERWSISNAMGKKLRD